MCAKNAATPTLEVIVLAAGLGTRMKSKTPKVLHQICDTPMLALLLEELEKAFELSSSIATVTRLNLVVGHGHEKVRDLIHSLQKKNIIKTPVVFSHQENQLGTGHAVSVALKTVKHLRLPPTNTVAVLNGDLPLFTAQALNTFLEIHFRKKSWASCASTILKNPGKYGRILRKGKEFVGIVEFKDASLKQLKIREINGGIYLFKQEVLEAAKWSNANQAQEYYLTSIFSQVRKQKKPAYALCFENPELLLGVNTMAELAEAQYLLYQKTAQKWMEQGVFIADPRHTYIGPKVKISVDCRIEPFTKLSGETTLQDGAQIGLHCDLKNVTIDTQTQIRNGTVAEDAAIGSNCIVGPMAHLRPGTKIADHARVGNFVEIKSSTIGSHTNAAHLSYIGDAEIGSNVNVGCGFITCNYDGIIRDGQRKHKTKIGNQVFIGSDVQLVAPIEITDGTYIASGSTVTESVKEPDCLVVARSRQVTKTGYAKKYRTK